MDTVKSGSRIKITAAVLTGVFLLFTTGSAKALNCAKPNEMQAIQLRALQTELMVRALTCRQNSEYNKFMVRFKKVLLELSPALKGYFHRVQNNPHTRETALTNFLTTLANKTSERGLNRPQAEFCASTQRLFESVLTRDKETLLGTALNRPADHSIKQCDETQLALLESQQ